MTNVWVVRADHGRYAEHFVSGGYAGIGWIDEDDLSKVKDRAALRPLYERAHPNDTSPNVIGQQVGQIARFLLEIKGGDYVIAPPTNTELLRYGRVAEDPSYYYVKEDDGCPFRHRRKVEWSEEPLSRSTFSIPLQYSLRSSLTVFAIAQREEFLAGIGHSGERAPVVPRYDSQRVVLERILELKPEDFETLAGHLLAALGFDDPEVIGRPGDGGVDVTGWLNASNLAKIQVFVQVKRYKLDAKISASTVKALRASIPNNGQGAFITTAGYAGNAADVANEANFPRIGLINGSQLVDLLVEHWDDIPQDFRDSLGLKRGLVKA